MQIALDESGNRISAENAQKGNLYRCPICNGAVILKQGSIKDAHFAHESNKCIDHWHYDMSEWHRNMQSRFPEGQREIVITYNGETHRADILFGNQIIEFQHSAISADEIARRNSFYRSAGYSIAWVFDLQEQYDAGRIMPCDRFDGIGFRWSRPKAVFKCFPIPHENDKNLVLYFYWVEYDGEEQFNRVIWSRHENGVPNFKEFIVSSYGIESNNPTSPRKVSEFFITCADLLNEHLATIPFRYSLKCSGPRGRPRDSYVCPRTGAFGIKQSGEKACSYCRYCAAIQSIPKGFQAYCCYPNQVNTVDESHPGYECSGIPQF